MLTKVEATTVGEASLTMGCGVIRSRFACRAGAQQTQQSDRHESLTEFVLFGLSDA
jgi:hypothetical protein